MVLETEVSGVGCRVSGVSPVAGLKNGQFNRKRNSEKANIECRIMNVEYRSNVFCQFYKNRLSEANPPFDIRYSAVRF
jgi:hypothetical protein